MCTVFSQGGRGVKMKKSKKKKAAASWPLLDKIQINFSENF